MSSGESNLPAVGFVGLGNMGHGMAVNILKAGHPLIIMAHRNRAAVEDVVSRGAVEVGSAREMAQRCDAVFLCVGGSENVDDLVRRSDGFADGASKGLIIADCTTSSPDTIRRLANDYPDIRFVDAPLGRSPKEAWEGRLSVMIGGSEEAVEQLRPILSSFADTIQYAGDLGSGHALKMVNNLVSMGYGALFAEALVLARKAGIEPRAVDELISSSRMNCEFFQTFMGWTRSGDARSHPFAIGSAAHVLSEIAGFSTDVAFDSRMIPAMRRIYQAAIDQGMESANLPELPRSVAIENHVSLRQDQNSG